MNLKINENNRTRYVLAVTAVMTVGFAVIAMLFFVSNMEYILNIKRTLFFSAIFSLMLVPIGLYFGLRRRVDLPALAFVLLISGAAIAVRIPLFDYMSTDYKNFLVSWVYELRMAPGLSGWKLDLGDYNMPYLYFLTFVAKQPLTPLYMIKLFSVVFDFILAYYAMQISSLVIKSPVKQLAVYTAVLFLPTVIINSAYWAQCDGVYTALAIAGLYYGLSNRPKLCVTMFALAFAFKLQTIFLLPILIVLLAVKKIQFRHLAFFPGVFLAVLVPALLAGKPFADAISIYVHQASQYARLTLSAPNIYQFLSNDVDFDMFSTAGILLAGTAVLMLLYYAWIKRGVLDTAGLLLIAYLFAIGIPYLLPRMHERYFYMADILSLAPFLINKKRWIIPVISVYASYRACTSFILSMSGVNFMYLAVLLFIVITVTVLDLTKHVSETEKRLPARNAEHIQ